MIKIVVFVGFNASSRPPRMLASRGEVSAHAERVGRPPRLAETAPRNHGGAGLGPGAPGQDRGADRRQHGGRGLLDLCAARRQHAGTLRHRRPQPRRRPPAPCCSSHEGLVGLVASEATPLNLCDAQNHPAFSFRPETGEEIYHSFLGVPILRAGNTLGVLVVQNRAKRTYVEEEVEALQTTAMVLAEMIASGELSALATARRRAGRAPLAAQDRRDPVRRHRARPCRAARAARRHHQLHRRGPAEGNQAARYRADQAARRSRPHAGARRRRRRRRAPRRAGSLSHVRQRSRLVAQAARGGRDRPHRGGRRRARAVRHPRAHAALDRSLSARAPARPRGSRPSPDAAAGRATITRRRASSCPTTRS